MNLRNHILILHNREYNCGDNYLNHGNTHMLQAPPPSQYDMVFNIGDIRVRVHPFFWLLTALLGSSAGSAQSVLIWIGVVFVSILIHELGHVLAFRRYGIDSHIILYHFGGLAVPDAYGWRSRTPTRQEHIVISLAGPAAGFLFAAITLLIVQLSGGYVDMGTATTLPSAYQFGVPLWVNEMIGQILWVNILWGLLNLAPLYPLDGGQVARDVWTMFNPRNGLRYSLQLSIITGVLIALVAILYWNSFFMAIMFGGLAAQSYQSMNGGGYY